MRMAVNCPACSFGFIYSLKLTPLPGNPELFKCAFFKHELHNLET